GRRVLYGQRRDQPGVLRVRPHRCSLGRCVHDPVRRSGASWHGPVTHACAFPGYDRSGEEAGGAELQIRRRLARMIHARGLGRRFGDKRALAGVDVDVGAGELLLVTGPNGSGKTTLLRLLAGLSFTNVGECEVPGDTEQTG